MKKLLIFLFFFISLHLYSQEVVVSPSQDFQSYLANLNNEMMGYLDYYLYDFQYWYLYLSEILAEGNDSLQQQSIYQTELIQDLIDNVIDYVEPQLEEIRANSTSEIVPTLHSIDERQKKISTDIKDVANKVDYGFTTANSSLNDILSTLYNISSLQDEKYRQDEENNQEQKEYYNSLEAAVNTLQQTLVDEVGPNLVGIAEHVAAINHNMDYLNHEGTQIEVLRAIGGNSSILENILISVNAMAESNNNSSNSFPKEILDDYNKINRDGEDLELGWKSSSSADGFVPGTLTLSSMGEETIKGGYFEQVLKLLKTHTKVDIESKETLLMILKTLNISEDNSSQANEFISDITSENNDAERDEKSAVDTDDRIELNDNDKYKSQLTKIKDTAQDLVSVSSSFNDAPSSIYLFIRSQGSTFNFQEDLPPAFVNTITTIHNSMPWAYGLIIFGSLSGLFFYLLGILYQIITHYKVV